MNLLEFLNSLPMADREPFAARCGTSFDYLRQIAYGNRSCRESLAMKIERESERKVTCEVLCPDAPWDVIRATPIHVRRNRRSTDKNQ